MNSSDTNFNRIEAYLFGSMTEEEKKAFENELTENPELTAQLGLHQTEHRAMELLMRRELATNLNAWKQEKETLTGEQTATGAKVVSMGKTYRLVFRIAAAASVLLIIGFFSRQFFAGLDDNQLASNYFDDSSLGARARGNDNTLPAELAPMLDRMAQKDYRGALGAVPDLPAGFLREKATLLKGECYFQLKDFAGAIGEYRSLLTPTADPSNREQAEWFLLLSYLAEGKHGAEADQLLQKILGDEGHGYYGKAKELKAAR